MEEEQYSFTVPPELANLRLDKLLVAHFPEYSRSYFQFLIDEQAVLLNGSPIKKRTKPKAGEEIHVCFILTEELQVKPQPIPLEILYEDEDLIAVNKPAGMVVHPAPGHPQDTFANALLFHCQTLPGMDSLRPGIVHRLDKDTSGVLLAAKTLRAHTKLVELFAHRNIEKYYVAVCVGCPKEGLIDIPIGRHPTQRKEMSVHSPVGKPAQSLVRVLKKGEELSCVEVQLLTGRTHQIRVHLRHVGAPVLGDAVYGFVHANTRHKAERQLLHAHRVLFPHPITSQPLSLTAPLPSDFEGWV